MRRASLTRRSLNPGLPTCANAWPGWKSNAKPWQMRPPCRGNCSSLLDASKILRPSSTTAWRRPTGRASATSSGRWSNAWRWPGMTSILCFGSIRIRAMVIPKKKVCNFVGGEASTVRRYLAVLSHAFTVAVQEWEWVPENPFLKVSKPKEPRGRVRFLSEDERQRLLDSCQVSRNSSLYTIVVLALSTGARRGELLSLHWSDVDLKRGMLTFRKTKNGETRAVPLTGYALEVLAHHTKIRRPDTTLVFPERTGTRPMSIREAWKFAIQRAGITNFRFHDLRHSAASYLAMGGASLTEIAEVLGHKTLQMTKRYTHLTESHTRGVVERMNQTIFGK